MRSASRGWLRRLQDSSLTPGQHTTKLSRREYYASLSCTMIKMSSISSINLMTNFQFRLLGMLHLIFTCEIRVFVSEDCRAVSADSTSSWFKFCCKLWPKGALYWQELSCFSSVSPGNTDHTIYFWHRSLNTAVTQLTNCHVVLTLRLSPTSYQVHPTLLGLSAPR